jgi:hypothetical protein
MFLASTVVLWRLTRLQGMFVKYIQQETGTRVQIKGIGSGFIENETGQEDPDPMHIHITSVLRSPLLVPTNAHSAAGLTTGRSSAQKRLRTTFSRLCVASTRR